MNENKLAKYAAIELIMLMDGDAKSINLIVPRDMINTPQHVAEYFKKMESEYLVKYNKVLKITGWRETI